MPTKDDKGAVTPKAQLKLSAREYVTVYSFDGLNALLLACRELERLGFSIESSLYKSSSGRYFLFIRDSAPESKKSPSFPLLSEFGELEVSENARTLLGEHGKCICRTNAVKTISEI